MNFDLWYEESEKEIISIRRYFHAHPELTHKELNTSKKIRELLSQKNIKFISIGETLTIAVIEGKIRGDCVAIRADIDALPITEETGLSFSSKNPNCMHACGHDIHIAMGLASAFFLNENKDSFSGTVKIIFQPAEEGGNGADLAVKSNEIDDCEAFFALHTWPLLQTGKIAMGSGAVCSSVDKFAVKIMGKGVHAAYPELSNDALLCASNIVVSLQNIVSRFVPSREAVVLGIGTFFSGEAWNVIAKQAVLEGTLRTFNEELRNQILSDIKNIINSIAVCNRCRADFSNESVAKVVFNDEALTDKLKRRAIAVFGNDSIVEQKPSSIGDDFSYYKEIAPCFYGFLGTHLEGEQYYPLHSSKLNADEKAMYYGVKWFVNMCFECLGEVCD